MAALLSCPICNNWADVKESRRVGVGAVRRRYLCADNHRFITVSQETVVSIMNNEEKYIPVNKKENP